MLCALWKLSLQVMLSFNMSGAPERTLDLCSVPQAFGSISATATAGVALRAGCAGKFGKESS